MDRGIQKLFSQVPETYELTNRVLTLGLDVVWRREAVRVAARGGGRRWMDVCSGTGETAAYLARRAHTGTHVFATDFCLPMLRLGREKPDGRRVRHSISEVKRLPFPDCAFDLVTLSFATRNINTSSGDLIAGFRELHRVLKPGGRLVNLETSQPRSGILRRVFHAYVRGLVEPVGTWMSGSRAAYRYLSRTIPGFHGTRELAAILRRAGFAEISGHRLAWGLAAIHRAVR